MVTRTRLNVALYVHCLFCLLSPCLSKRETVVRFLKEQIGTYPDSVHTNPGTHSALLSNQCKGLFASVQGGQKLSAKH